MVSANSISPPGVSVIITTYNYSRFVGAAIESVLKQTLPPAEIVVVDDGSTDDTRSAVEPYLDRGVRYIRQGTGVPERRATGACAKLKANWWPSSTLTTAGSPTNWPGK